MQFVSTREDRYTMPASTTISPWRIGARRWWPEALVAILAAVTFLSLLGSVEIWGKREQRASLEALDTVDHGHWLVAWIQGHPRLEKPPLSRWIIASLIALTGRRDETIIRLPTAISALAMVGLVYLLGQRIMGRSVGLASAMILCSTPFFIAEMRQAGNDGILALFTTLSLYAAWRRLEGGSRRWVWLMNFALGMGILAKGPIVLMFAGVTIVPYLMLDRRLKAGLRSLFDERGLLILLLIGLTWPMLVLINDPHALGVWTLEMGQKVGVDQFMEHRRHAWLVKDWPGMVFPWAIIALAAVVFPFLKGNKADTEKLDSSHRSPIWFPWFWSFGNLAILCTWRVAKPSYYLPCLPGTALLLGAAWVHLTREARLDGKAGAPARYLLQLQWVILFVGAAFAPAFSRGVVTDAVWPWIIGLSVVLLASVILSVTLWRKGADVLSLSPLLLSMVVIIVVTYGIIAPAENLDRGHRDLALTVERIIPESNPRLFFLQEMDEGLAFYLGGYHFEPVPGSRRRYNATYDYLEELRNNRRKQITKAEAEQSVPEELKRSLLEWAAQERDTEDFVIVPTKFYDRFAVDLSTNLAPVLREVGKKRNDLTLLQISRNSASSVATKVDSGTPTRR